MFTWIHSTKYKTNVSSDMQSRQFMHLPSNQHKKRPSHVLNMFCGRFLVHMYNDRCGNQPLRKRNKTIVASVSMWTWRVPVTVLTYSVIKNLAMLQLEEQDCLLLGCTIELYCCYHKQSFDLLLYQTAPQRKTLSSWCCFRAQKNQLQNTAATVISWHRCWRYAAPD